MSSSYCFDRALQRIAEKVSMVAETREVTPIKEASHLELHFLQIVVIVIPAPAIDYVRGSDDTELHCSIVLLVYRLTFVEREAKPRQPIEYVSAREKIQGRRHGIEAAENVNGSFKSGISQRPAQSGDVLHSLDDRVTDFPLRHANLIPG
jgi:hypothetical protein